ncbi:TRAP transporter small permease subunit [Nitratireductor pacificus]|uniref:TRAP transporter small permease protein n=1 Tax=Nitratireductor pacificus pht-3B TaxID=391937 RepID=K2MFR8_9HYPH|nr:TRAP transporter small permease subunit [Nitratireductor pacificus]EKF21001.1 TRAP-T family transporter, DctQ (4 TMs) subunit [Nitratireductor pacificus pht-3B]
MTRIAAFSTALGAMALLMMTLVVVLDVGSRNLLSTPLTGTTEMVSHWFMVAILFLTIGSAQAERLHITVDLFGGAGPVVNALLDLAAALLMVAAMAGLAWFTASEALHATVRGERIEFPGFALPVWSPRWLVPAGLVLTGLIAAAQGLDAVARLRRPRP